jgi:hypothetical protein
LPVFANRGLELYDDKDLAFKTVAKTMLVLHEGLADAVKIVSFIKAGLLNSCV